HRWIHARSRSEQRQLILQITPLLPGKARDGAIHGAPCIRCMAGCARSVETDAFGCGKCRLRNPESRHGQKARGKPILELLTMVFHGGSLIKLPTLAFKGIHLPRGTSGTCVEGFQLEVSKKRRAATRNAKTRHLDTYIHGSCSRAAPFRIPLAGVPIHLQEKIMSLIRWEPFGD